MVALLGEQLRAPLLLDARGEAREEGLRARGAGRGGRRGAADAAADRRGGAGDVLEALQFSFR